jgi:hypothetical protein
VYLIQYAARKSLRGSTNMRLNLMQNMDISDQYTATLNVHGHRAEKPKKISTPVQIFE